MATFDTFISYSHKDKTTADATCAALEAVGIRCWIAPRDIVSGMDWGEAIIDAIMGARIMVLIFSGSSNISPQVKREVERAVHRRIPVIPLRLEQVPMSKSLEYFLSTSHWLDALTPPLEKHLQHLTESVRTLLKRVGAEINGPDVTEPAGSTSPRPTTPVAFNNRGTAFFNRRDYDRAIAEFDEAIRLDPTSRLPSTVEVAHTTVRATTTAPSRTMTRRSVSIPRTLHSSRTAALRTGAKAIAIALSRIMTKRSVSVPTRRRISQTGPMHTRKRVSSTAL
jgi:hypothetical protein